MSELSIEKFSKDAILALEEYKACLHTNKMPKILLEKPKNLSIKEWVLCHNCWFRGFLMAFNISSSEEYDLAQFAERHDFWCIKE